MRSIDELRRVQRRGFVVTVGRDDEPQVLPVVEILRAVTLRTPAADFSASGGELFVLTVPVEAIATLDDRAPMGLDGLTLGIRPRFARFEGMPHLRGRSISGSRWHRPKGMQGGQ